MEGFVVALREMLVERCLNALCRGGCRIIVYCFGAAAPSDCLMQCFSDGWTTQKASDEGWGGKQQGFEFVDLQVRSEMMWTFQSFRQAVAQSVGRLARDAAPESVKIV